MSNKIKPFQAPAQHLIAGLIPGSEDIEFYGVPKTKEVKWLQHGQVHDFADLSPRFYSMLKNAYTFDKPARAVLEMVMDSKGTYVYLPVTRQVELYCYYCYGDLDNTPDIKDGVLQPAENYRHDENCISLQFASKAITMNGIPLKPREITMIDRFGQDQKDEVVALELNIKRQTLNQHKKELFLKAGVFSKPALLLKACAERILIPHSA